MFNEDDNWGADASTESLNKGLFGQVEIVQLPPTVQKKLKRKNKKKAKHGKLAEVLTNHGEGQELTSEKKFKQKKRKLSEIDDQSFKRKCKTETSDGKAGTYISKEGEVTSIMTKYSGENEDIKGSKKKRKKLKNKVLVSADPQIMSDKAFIKKTNDKKLPFVRGDLKSVLKGQHQTATKTNGKPLHAEVQMDSREDNGSDVPTKMSKEAKKNLTTRERMKMQLNAARFRYLNEQLYTSSSKHASSMFKEDPEAFTVYHTGFQSQVACWPVNPVDQMILFIKARPSSMVVADFGCGDAKIARSVPNKVHSFDLVAVNEHVTVCDISKVPLKDQSIDIVVICLALMGNNWVDFLREATRVLKLKGTLRVTEVASRFQDVRKFVKLVEVLGFTLKQQDSSNKMFTCFEFSKTRVCKPGHLPDVSLTPCVYKKR